MINNKIINKRIVAFFLTMIGGFLEIYSYLLLGKVFATTITGNLILMVFNLKRLELSNVTKYIVPIIFFCFGVLIAEKIKSKVTINFSKLVLFLEILILSFIPFVGIQLISVSLIAFISGIQIQTFRKISDNVYMSTMCTGNTRALVEALVNGRKQDIKDYFVVVSGFLTGVLLGDISIIFFDKFSIYVCVLILLLIFYIIKKVGKNEVIR
ncbi:YoaK family protein [Streptobacillus notomytis]|uniref:YoaK family protein n=1 Tax=Streptobacillus notomytis TaxID=1712031 RepID=UPI0009373881|nr:YoaK family protein [Streptobacillus notomytis]